MFFIGFYYPNYAVRWKRVKWIDGSKTRYLISNIGIVVNEKTGKIMKTNFNEAGYERVNLTHNGQRRQFFVHGLVARAFVKNPKNKPEVNHINGVKSANYDANLEWVTRSENQIHAVLNGLIIKKRGRVQIPKKTMHKMYSLIVENKKTISQIAKEVGVSRHTVSSAIKNKHALLDGISYNFEHYESKPVFTKFGEGNHEAKYTEAQIETVCQLLDSGKHSIREVSDLSEIPYQTVRNVYYGNCWIQIASKYDFFRNKTRVNTEKEKVVNKICDLLDEGYNTREVSEMLGVSRSVVRCIYSGQSWSSLTKDRKFMKNKKSC